MFDVATRFHGYRVSSARLQYRDYASEGSYFVTICTKNRISYFGMITDGIMHRSLIGTIADQYWQTIPDHFPYVQLGEYVVMPDHIHGILTITERQSLIDDGVIVETPNLGVSTGVDCHWKTGTLGVIVNQYKRICTIHARKCNDTFAWQPRFYDRVIRHEQEYERITRYIKNNVQNWNRDHGDCMIDDSAGHLVIE